MLDASFNPCHFRHNIHDPAIALTLSTLRPELVKDTRHEMCVLSLAALI